MKMNLIVYCFVNSYCVIPSNIPFVIQRDVLVCEQSDRWHVSLQTYIAAVGRCFLWCIRMPNTLFHRYSTSNGLTLRCADFTLKCIGGFVIYLNIIEKKQST